VVFAGLLPIRLMVTDADGGGREDYCWKGVYVPMGQEPMKTLSLLALLSDRREIRKRMEVPL